LAGPRVGPPAGGRAEACPPIPYATTRRPLGDSQSKPPPQQAFPPIGGEAGRSRVQRRAARCAGGRPPRQPRLRCKRHPRREAPAECELCGLARACACGGCSCRPGRHAAALPWPGRRPLASCSRCRGDAARSCSVSASAAGGPPTVQTARRWPRRRASAVAGTGRGGPPSVGAAEGGGRLGTTSPRHGPPALAPTPAWGGCSAGSAGARRRAAGRCGPIPRPSGRRRAAVARTHGQRPPVVGGRATVQPPHLRRPSGGVGEADLRLGGAAAAAVVCVGGGRGGVRCAQLCATGLVRLPGAVRPGRTGE